jgi:putative protease
MCQDDQFDGKKVSAVALDAWPLAWHLFKKYAMVLRMCAELLSPAGSFDAGFYALQNGADALYLGLVAFSARRAARNFSLEEFARIKRLAESGGRRVYAAVNTLLSDEELPAVVELLYELQALNANAIIIQDYGLLEIIKKHFGGMAVHASTQMGAHNAEGVRFLAGEGVQRVILARELTLGEIGRIREECPDIELEVFIHGASCYSFSGLCLASGIRAGRSGNRGECAQLCRSRYAVAGGEGAGTSGYFFSRSDLCLGEYVLRLRELGINSLKIEGRMKSPEWVAAVTAYYRAVLDGGEQGEREALLEKSRVIFSRASGTGFFEGEGLRTIDSRYPGHTGVFAGVAEKSSQGGFALRLKTRLAVRDGLLYFDRDGNPCPFAVSALSLGGKKINFARPGQLVCLPGPEIPAGTELRKISSHDSRLPSVSQKLPPRRVGLRLYFRLLPQGLEIRAEAENPALHFGTFSANFSFVPQAARRPRPFTDIIAAYLAPPEDSRFAALGETGFANESGLPDDGVYVNPSSLKSIRRQAYSRLEEHYASAREAKKASVLEDGTARGRPWDGAAFPPRARLADASCGLPFIADPGALKKENLFTDGGGRLYIPLAPVLLGDAASYLRGVCAFVRQTLAGDKNARCALGLCNAGHLGLTKIFAEERRVEFFIDYGLYCANSRAAVFFASRTPRLLFHLPWVEREQTHAAYAGFRPPLFIGRGFRREGRTLLRQGKWVFAMRTVRVAGAWLEMAF